MGIGYKSFTINGKPANGLTLKMGDDPECLLIVYGDNAGASIDFMVKNLITDPDNAAIMSKTGTAGGTGQAIDVDITGNALTARFTITSTETRNLPIDTDLIYGIQMRVGTKTTTIEEGVFKISPDVIQDDD